MNPAEALQKFQGFRNVEKKSAEVMTAVFNALKSFGGNYHITSIKEQYEGHFILFAGQSFLIRPEWKLNNGEVEQAIYVVSYVEIDFKPMDRYKVVSSWKYDLGFNQNMIDTDEVLGFWADFFDDVHTYLLDKQEETFSIRKPYA